MDFYEIKGKEELLSRYAGDYPRLRGMNLAPHEELIDFVPDIPEAWSMREHLSHLADVEIRAFIRYRSSILSSGIELVLGGGDVDKSNRLLNYSKQKVEDSLEIIRLLRKITLEHVSDMDDAALEGHCIRHPDLGVINLKMVLSIATQHVDKHVGYLLRNITLFNEKTKRVLPEIRPRRGRRREAKK
jgi:hypothetical protein